MRAGRDTKAALLWGVDVFMAHQSAHQPIRTLRHHIYRWSIALIVPLVVLVAACSGASKSTAKATPAAATAGGSTPTVATTVAPGQTLPQITPIPGDYSVYVDPTFGYSFEYPSQWITYPSNGTAPGPSDYSGSVKESNVDIADPTSPDPQHPSIQLMVRVTNNYNAQFVDHWLCNPDGTESQETIDGYTGENLSETGGDEVSGLAAPAWGFIFPVKAKGLVVEVWLQSSARRSNDIYYFQQSQKANFQHVLDTFNPGPGMQQIGSC